MTYNELNEKPTFVKKQVWVTINDLSGVIFYISGTKHGQEQHYLLDMGGSDINYANGERGGLCHYVTRSCVYFKVILLNGCKIILEITSMYGYEKKNMMIK